MFVRVQVSRSGLAHTSENRELAVSRGLFRKAATKTMPITMPVSKAFNFPSVCPCCMVSLSKETTGYDRIKADENALGFFLEAMSGKRVMPIRVPYCQPCYRHIRQYRTPDTWGCFGILVIIATIFVGVKIGLWAAIVAVAIPPMLWFLVLRPSRLRKAEGLRSPGCCATGSGVTFSGLSAFTFQNDAYARAFSQVNGIGH